MPVVPTPEPATIPAPPGADPAAPGTGPSPEIAKLAGPIARELASQLPTSVPPEERAELGGPGAAPGAAPAAPHEAPREKPAAEKPSTRARPARAEALDLPPSTILNRPNAQPVPALSSRPAVWHEGYRLSLPASAVLPCGHAMIASEQPGTSISAECSARHLWLYDDALGWRLRPRPSQRR